MSSSIFTVFFVSTATVVVVMNILVWRIVIDLFESSKLNKDNTDHYGYQGKFIFIGGYSVVFGELRNRHPIVFWGFYLFWLISGVFLYVSAT